MELIATFLSLLVLITASECEAAGAVPLTGRLDAVPSKQGSVQSVAARFSGPLQEVFTNENDGVNAFGAEGERNLNVTRCSPIYTSGATIQTFVNGKYSERSETCNDRPSYAQTGTSEGTIYLYCHLESDHDQLIWSIGPAVCGETGYAAAVDDALTPDSITAYWKEYNVQSQEFEENRNMQTKCSGSSGNGSAAHMTMWLLLSIVMVKTIL